MAVQRRQPQSDMRDRILEEATRLFGNQGYGSTSVQAIAEGVGIRKPSLLYHFSSKDKLREAVIENLMAHWKGEIPRLLSAATSGHDRFSSTITAVVDFFLEDGNRARLAAREALDRPEAVSGMIRHHLSPWIKLVTDYIRLGQKSDIVKKEVDPEAYVIQVVMMVIGTAAFGVVGAAIAEGDSTGRIENQIQELIRIARVGLFVHPEDGDL